MKRIICVLTLIFGILFCINAYAAEDVMKIAMDGDVKYAKEIGTGKGISFTLPELNEKDYVIYAIELAVFEKQDGESSWHIYRNASGEESKKKYIEHPQSLNFSVDFGAAFDYKDKAKYKIAYRYYVQNILDSSKTMIAGADLKDGWRLVGEDDVTKATANGLVFYKNALPTMNIECFSYKYHSLDGLMTNDCSPEELDTTYFPKDAFANGIVVQMTANDFDREDVLTVSYRLEDAVSGALVSEGALPSNHTISTDYETEAFKLRLTVSDNFGGSVTSDWMTFMIDTESAQVISEFNDGGYALKGRNLFSDFQIMDDSNSPMIEGIVFADIYLEGKLVDSVQLANRGNGVFRLDKTGMADGHYTVSLKMFDKAGNVSEHTFSQTLDNTAPTAHFVTPAENSVATLYSTWMNESKDIIIKVYDEYAGLKRYVIYLQGGTSQSGYFGGVPNAGTVIRHVDNIKTGKLWYYGYIYDDAKTINKTTNTIDASSSGNYYYVSKYVWLDKTSPVITTNHLDNGWKEAPYTVNATFYDYPSTSGVDDASGVSKKYYAVTETNVIPQEWKTYSSGVTLTEGGVYYVHFKAVDYAGNEKIETVKVRINSKSQMTGRVRPTEDYKHTIYYSTPGFYVAKATAYNTKYHFELKDNDISDVIKTKVKLVNQDDSSVYGIAECETAPNGTINRDIVFNMAYLDLDINELPDGVYDMLLTISEVKNDGEEVVTHENVSDCEVVIKRNAPPTPIIKTEAGMVSIDYPEETLAGSLNSAVVRSHYQQQYKAVKDGETSTNLYKTYTGSFTADNFIVTALYTDIAGNTSVATKRIYKDDQTDGEDSNDILTSGDNTVVEESRAANVYYIGIRRDKHNGINNDVFGFIE